MLGSSLSSGAVPDDYPGSNVFREFAPRNGRAHFVRDRPVWEARRGGSQPGCLPPRAGALPE